jgi:hypothetical protein
MINALIDQIKKRRMEIALSLADGHAINIESYHRLVGLYQGLGEALDVLDNLLDKEDNS